MLSTPRANVGQVDQGWSSPLSEEMVVNLLDLESIEDPQVNILEALDNCAEKLSKRKTKLSEVMDVINSRFGKDSITIGSVPNSISVFSGTKVAFTRIPEIKEFYE